MWLPVLKSVNKPLTVIRQPQDDFSVGVSIGLVRISASQLCNPESAFKLSSLCTLVFQVFISKIPPYDPLLKY